jgi:hypothetical protein
MPREAKETIPKSWPKDSDAKFTSGLLYSPSMTPALISALHQPPENFVLLSDDGAAAQKDGRINDGPILLARPPPSPSPLVVIRRIADPAHPACGQHGLFAATALAHGRLIVLYAGRVHAAPPPPPPPAVGGVGQQQQQQQQPRADGKGDDAHAASDYDFALDAALGVAVDAAREGSEARFVNDFRGVRARPNAAFGDVWVRAGGRPGRGAAAAAAGAVERYVGVFAACGRGAVIRKGEEIVVSYGKGFWRARAPPAEEQGEDAPDEKTGAA